MDPQLRGQFNADFTPEKYAALVRCVNETERWPADFRISETPIFLTREFTEEVARAANEIIALTRTAEFARHAASAVPKELEVPNESPHPNFHVVDFAICAEGERLVPRLERRMPRFRATGRHRLGESKTRRMSICYDARSSPTRLRRT